MDAALKLNGTKLLRHFEPLTGTSGTGRSSTTGELNGLTGANTLSDAWDVRAAGSLDLSGGPSSASTAAAHRSFELGNATGSSWATLRTGSTDTLRGLGFKNFEMRQVDRHNVLADWTANGPTGLSECVVDYEKNGERHRLVGCMTSLASGFLRAFDVETSQFVDLCSGRDGVDFKDIWVKGGSPAEVDTQKEVGKDPNVVYSFRLTDPVTGEAHSVMGFARKHETHYELRALDGAVYILDRQLLEDPAHRPPITAFYPKSADEIPAVPQAGAGKVVSLIAPDHQERVETFLRGFEAKGELYSNEFFEWFRARPEQAERFLTRLYPAHDPQLLNSRVRQELDAGYLSLFLHPQLAARWGEVLEFAKDEKQRDPGCSPYEIFKAFEARQGTSRLFRGLVLDEAQARELERREVPIRPPGMLDPADAKQWVSRFFNPYSPDPNLTRAINEGCNYRLGAQGSPRHRQSYELMSSFSRHRDIATSVPYWRARMDADELPEGKHLYLLEVDVPNLSIIDLGARYPNGGALMCGGRTYIPSEDPGYEQVVASALPPSALHSIQREDQEPPPFRKVRRVY